MVEHRESLTEFIVDRARRLGSTALASMGDLGYCGHADHSAAHYAALAAQEILYTRHDITLPVFSLNHRHEGSVVVPVQRNRKLSALALHASQFGFLQSGSDLPPTHRIYEPLLYAETYDTILPAALSMAA